MVFPGFCCGENPVCRKACDVQYHFNPLFPHKNIMLAFLGEKTCSLHHYLTTPAWHLRSYSNQAHSLSEQEWYFKRRVMVGCLMACQGSIGMALAIWILSFYQEKKKNQIRNPFVHLNVKLSCTKASALCLLLKQGSFSLWALQEVPS